MKKSFLMAALLMVGGSMMAQTTDVVESRTDIVNPRVVKVDGNVKVLGNGIAQTTDDPVIMRVNGVPVTRSEFEYSFNKNNADGVLDKKGVQDYVPLFVDFKLKVEEAKAQGIDTLQSIRDELEGYKEQMVMPTLVDSDYVEREALQTYKNTAERFAGQDLLTASHILVLMRQDADMEAQAVAKARIDSIYAVLQGGADFAEVAKQCSDDKGSAVRGGEPADGAPFGRLRALRE